MEIYLVRHGETEFNRLGIVQGSGVDSPLNLTGRRQAKAFFLHYGAVPFELVVTSRLQRTHQTLEPFIRKNIPWVQTPDINEISWGEYEGQPGSPERSRHFKSVVTDWQQGKYDSALPGGESARMLGERVGRFLEWLRTRDEHRILVGTHGRTLRCMVSLLKGQGLEGMETVEHANTGCYILHYINGRFEMKAENSIRHLQLYNPE